MWWTIFDVAGAAAIAGWAWFGGRWLWSRLSAAASALEGKSSGKSSGSSGSGPTSA